MTQKSDDLKKIQLRYLERINAHDLPDLYRFRINFL